MMVTTEYVGLRLNAKTDDPKDLDRVIEVINEAIENFGYRIDTWGTWDQFREFCVENLAFEKALEERVTKEYCVV